MSMTTSFAKSVGAAGVALLALAAPALASDITPPPEGRTFGWSVNAAITSDYIFRGVSQTDNDPAISAGADFSYGILYAGFWASNVDETISADNIEIDYYAGIKPVLGPATFDFGILYYTYPGAEVAAGDPETVEFKAAVSGEILPKLSATAALYYSPELAGDLGEYFVYEGTLAYALPKIFVFDPTISGTIGAYDYDDDTLNTDYTYWNAGITFGWDKFAFDFRYWDTDEDLTLGGAVLSDERFVFTAKLTYGP
jgi:uncharacterized protein (TIGR02001 family)